MSSARRACRAALARRVASMQSVLYVFDIVEDGRVTERSQPEVMATYFALGSRLGIDWLRDRILELPRADRWQALARAALRDDLYRLHRSLTRDVLLAGRGDNGGRSIDAWRADNDEAVERALGAVRRQGLGQLRHDDVAGRPARAQEARARRLAAVAPALPGALRPAEAIVCEPWRPSRQASLSYRSPASACGPRSRPTRSSAASSRPPSKLGGQMRVPGFRKGKVPPTVVIRRLGREAVLDEALRSSLGRWYVEAIDGAGIAPVGDPELDVGDLPAEGDPLEFSIEIGVRPRATLGTYKGLEVGRREPQVDESAIDAELERAARPARDARDRRAPRGQRRPRRRSTTSAASTASASTAARAATS